MSSFWHCKDSIMTHERQTECVYHTIDNINMYIYIIVNQCIKDRYRQYSKFSKFLWWHRGVMTADVFPSTEYPNGTQQTCKWKRTDVCGMPEHESCEVASSWRKMILWEWKRRYEARLSGRMSKFAVKTKHSNYKYDTSTDGIHCGSLPSATLRQGCRALRSNTTYTQLNDTKAWRRTGSENLRPQLAARIAHSGRPPRGGTGMAGTGKSQQDKRHCGRGEKVYKR